jgi:hypothetical protein
VGPPDPATLACGPQQRLTPTPKPKTGQQIHEPQPPRVTCSPHRVDHHGPKTPVEHQPPSADASFLVKDRRGHRLRAGGGSAGGHRHPRRPGQRTRPREHQRLARRKERHRLPLAASRDVHPGSRLTHLGTANVPAIQLWDAHQSPLAGPRPTQWVGDPPVSPDTTHLADARRPARVLRPRDRACGPG